MAIGQIPSVLSMLVESIDDLRSPISNADINITQLGSGRVQGNLTRVALGEISFSLGSFSSPIRATGVFSSTYTTIGMLLSGSDPSVVWGAETLPGSVMCAPPGQDHDIRYLGRASFAGLSIQTDHLSKMGFKDAAGEQLGLERKSRYVPPTDRSAEISHYLGAIASTISREEAQVCSHTVDFWTRSVVDAFLGEILVCDSVAVEPIPSTTRIVREVENYLSGCASRPVHVSEICLATGVSRRTLHRAFHDTLGMGPSTFLRRKRLGDVHNRLLAAKPGSTQVTHIATEFGFIELGRFSQYYKALFGEHPSETLKRVR